jgi:hypothetical protein
VTPGLSLASPKPIPFPDYRTRVDVFREYSIEVELVPEYYTSKECPACRITHENNRVYKGLKAISVFTITRTIYILPQTKRLLSPTLTLYVEMMRLHSLLPAGVL